MIYRNRTLVLGTTPRQQITVLNLRMKKPLRCKGLGGSRSWTRTNDPLINSQLLYQLSYSGTAILLGFFLSLRRLRVDLDLIWPTDFPAGPTSQVQRARGRPLQDAFHQHGGALLASLMDGIPASGASAKVFGSTSGPSAAHGDAEPVAVNVSPA